MKRGAMLAAFVVVLGCAVAAICYTQRHAKQTPVSANAVLQMAADAQRDLSRAPMHLTRISDEEEISIGRELAARYTPLHPSLNAEQAALDAYVKKVGAAVAGHAHRKLPYEFHVIPDRSLINAFSLPGGPVYVGQGMLDQMLTEDELANVLGHEVEHIDHYHCVERVQVEAQLKHLDLGVIGELLQIPLALWETGYNKDEELEADREGMFLAVAAGYSPYGAVKLFEQFAKLEREYVIHAETPEQELSELALQSLEGYFRTHPLPSERLDQANRLIVEQKWEGKKEQRNFRIEYQVRE
ncbi:MAG TPA: M48 family metallopeptidase [Candidatus Acidoferrales bacterium]|nr:M48 family metallopeptidase [Candidatus Acidoferrales bacterium]